MWSMRSSATEGFTLSEMLLALGTAMLCSVLLTWMVRFFVIGIHMQQQLVQDQIAVLQLRLLCQMLRLRGGSLLRAGRADGKPEMAAQMIAGAKLLLRLAQAFRRVEGMPEAAFDVGAILGGVLF